MKCLFFFHVFASFFAHGHAKIIDVNECLRPDACGTNAECINTAGNYTCACPDGYYGDPYVGCADVDECAHPDACGPGAICTNLDGSYRCDCPQGFHGDARSPLGCGDEDECAKSAPCGRNALCENEVGSYRCLCPPGFYGDPTVECEGKYLLIQKSYGNKKYYVAVHINAYDNKYNRN